MAAHKSTVNDISFDEAVEFIASCSDDGTVVVRRARTPSCERAKLRASDAGAPSVHDAPQVQGFYTDEMSKYHYRRPVKVRLRLPPPRSSCRSAPGAGPGERRCSRAAAAPQTVALDPRYGSRKTREFISGGLAGQLTLNSRVRARAPLRARRPAPAPPPRTQRP